MLYNSSGCTISENTGVANLFAKDCIFADGDWRNANQPQIELRSNEKPSKKAVCGEQAERRADAKRPVCGEQAERRADAKRPFCESGLTKE